MGQVTELGAAALSAGVGALGSIAGSVAGGLFSANQARKNRAFQERMYNKQVEDTIKFWNMQNEYNLPSAAYAREIEGLTKNGLNPQLMYGNGAVQSVAADQPQLPSAPHGAQGNVGSFNTPIDLANLALLKQQINESKSREALNYEDAKNKGADTNLKGLQGEQLKITTSFDKDSYQLRLDILNSEKDLKDSMFYLNYREANKLFKEVQVMDKQIENLDSEISARKEITQATVDKYKAEVQQGWKRLSGELALMSAQARNALANAYAARVNADIAKGLYSPEMIKILQGKAGQEFLNAIRSGDGQILQNGILAKEFGMTADYNTTAGKIKFWCDNVVSPITGIISDVAVTAGGVGLATKSLSGAFSAPSVTTGTPHMGKIGFQ